MQGAPGEIVLEISGEPEDQAVEQRPTFDQLMAANWQMVLRTAYRLLGHTEDAQDAAHEGSEGVAVSGDGERV